MQILKLLTIVATMTVVRAQPIEVSDAVVDNVWETTSIEKWPWVFNSASISVISSPFTIYRPIALASAPTGSLNLVNFVPQPRLIETVQPLQTSRIIHQHSPIDLTLPPTPLLSDEIAGKLTNVAKSLNNENVTKENSKTATPPKPRSRAKLQPTTSTTTKYTADFKDDVRLLRAVQQINSEFEIEDIVAVPGQHILKTVSMEKLSKHIKLSAASTASPLLLLKSSNSADSEVLSIKNKYTGKLRSSKRPSLKSQSAESEVKVEAIGHTATLGTIPQIPFGTYFLPYFAQGQQDITKTAALILEPHSKAVVGNGGTAVSIPISKAFLKRGIPTNVFFNPESVAIAGVGGKAHAQADLELDLVESRK